MKSTYNFTVICTAPRMSSGEIMDFEISFSFPEPKEEVQAKKT